MTANWFSPDTAWSLKTAHASRHIERLAQVCAEYRSHRPQHVEPEPTDDPGTTAYRLRIAESIPAEISLVLGDILHNLRSALDGLVFGMVAAEAGRELNPDEERACQFPIVDTPTSFERFFDDNRWRKTIMSLRLRDALRVVQPFYWLERAKAHGVAQDEQFASNSRHHDLATLARMSNLDKHRRLAVTAWWPNIVYWGSNDESERRWLPGDGTFDDGSIVGYMVGPNGVDVVYEFNLILADPIPPAMAGAGYEVVSSARAWQRATDLAIRQVIARYEWTGAG